MINADKVRELLDYSESTGEFRWRKRVSRTAKGTVAGKLKPNGYVSIGISKRNYLAHRLAWLYVHGEMPSGQIDHINGVRNDNRIANLRDVTRSENCQNIRAARKDNKSCGLLGATWCKRDRRWVAGITVNGKRKSLGCHDTAEQAHQAYLTAKAKFHPSSTLVIKNNASQQIAIEP